MQPTHCCVPSSAPSQDSNYVSERARTGTLLIFSAPLSFFFSSSSFSRIKITFY